MQKFPRTFLVFLTFFALYSNLDVSLFPKVSFLNRVYRSNATKKKKLRYDAYDNALNNAITAQSEDSGEFR